MHMKFRNKTHRIRTSISDFNRNSSELNSLGRTDKYRTWPQFGTFILRN